ncbi:hypothetical protein Nepgr_023011 [Nepenthes gracilis]|uniref:Uncharacterized protein n=1 Tax=Nepenthes gracilis TaxID=150966 RepID=A0AAD3T257_NEPGR|nr:hypothetical protein Nepgr_023011 [Nepenthes gracilis]
MLAVDVLQWPIASCCWKTWDAFRLLTALFAVVLDRVPGGVAGTFCGCWKRDGLLPISCGVEAGLFADGFVLKGYEVALVCWLSVVYMYRGPLLMHLIFASQIFWLLQVLRLTIAASFS